jgi:hypothetical protein
VRRVHDGYLFDLLYPRLTWLLATGSLGVGFIELFYVFLHPNNIELFYVFLHPNNIELFSFLGNYLFKYTLQTPAFTHRRIKIQSATQALSVLEAQSYISA